MQVSPPTQFLQTFQQMRGQWFAAVQGPAQTLFGLLALIEFAWSAAVLALRTHRSAILDCRPHPQTDVDRRILCAAGLWSHLDPRHC